MSPSAKEITVLIASLLRGEAASLETVASADDQALFTTTAADHGVDGLLRRHLKQIGLWSVVPDEIRMAFDEQVRRLSVLEAVRRQELTEVLTRLSQAHVKVLVLKGAALAYTHYPAPYLRPCLDMDLLVEKTVVEGTAVALEALGYRRQNSVGRDAVHSQLMFERVAGAFRHVVDLHWAISNRPLFADMLTFRELAATAVPVTQLGNFALAPGDVEALLYACIHRVAHHNDSHSLIWLYDIRLLADRLSSDDWNRFWRLAVEKRLLAVCQESLAVTAALVGVRANVSERLTMATETYRGASEASATYLGGVGNQLSSVVLDLKAAPGLRGKLRLLAGHAFPDPVYMQNAYGTVSRLGLTGAYLRRAAGGFWRAMTSHVDRTSIPR